MQGSITVDQDQNVVTFYFFLKAVTMFSGEGSQECGEAALCFSKDSVVRVGEPRRISTRHPLMQAPLNCDPNRSLGASHSESVTSGPTDELQHNVTWQLNQEKGNGVGKGKNRPLFCEETQKPCSSPASETPTHLVVE